MKRIISVFCAITLILSVFSFSVSAKGRFLYGDINADGTINSADALSALQHATQIKVLNKSDKAIADVNLDGIVNSSDALEILRYSVGISSGFDKDYSKTLKYTKVEKVVDSGVYTIQVSCVIDGNDTTLVFTSDGTRKTVSTTVKINLREMLADVEDASIFMFLVPAGKTPIEIRFCTDKDGKCYLLFPKFKLYCEIDEGDTPDELVDILFGTENLYEKREKKTESGKTVVTETYITDSQASLNYKFTDDKLVNVVLSDAKETINYKIENFSPAADSSLLGVPSGYTYSKELADALGY